MDDFRTGRVNALAYAIYETGGDEEKLRERLHFFTDLTEADVQYAVDLARWFETEGGQESLEMCRQLKAKEQ